MAAQESPIATHVRDRIDRYVGDIVRHCDRAGTPLVSVVLFGSGATGGYTVGVSDLDLLLVLDDASDAAESRRITQVVSDLEILHGLAKPKGWPGDPSANAMQRIADRLTANVRTFFVCTRADLLSGEPGRILSLSWLQALFVDRIAAHSIVGSGRTVWGADLLSHVALPPIRRTDIGKAYFGLINQAVFVSAVYPFLPHATRYAMEAVKRSVHSCYFCYHARPAPLSDEVSYFVKRYGSDHVLERLLSLRTDYQESFSFVLRSLGAISRLHIRAGRDAQIPPGGVAAPGPAS